MKDAIQLFISKFYQAIILILLAVVLIFGIGWFSQVWYTNHLSGQINTLKKEHADYLKDQELATSKAKAAAATQEKQWSDQLLKAEQNYNAKLKQIQTDAHSARSSADSLSKQLKVANSNMSTASRETIIEYSETTNKLLEDCSNQYIWMAERADEERIDKEKLSEGWVGSRQ